MGLVKLDQDADHLVTPQYSQARGPVLRSGKLELTKAAYPKGRGAVPHRHPEEQIIYVLSGRGRVKLGDEEYDVGPGDASFHPSNVEHGLHVLEDMVVISVKSLVDPQYEATGVLE